jgi:LysR family transcriptional regulator, glycine cleavage system transcriptional activator
VEPLPKLRMTSPMAYWLIRATRTDAREGARPELDAFCDWLRAKAGQTQSAFGTGASKKLV